MPQENELWINKRYHLQDIVGKGGMGEVYKAYDRLTQSTVALKRVTTSAANLLFNSRNDDTDLHLALAQEFKTLASLRHPYVISVLDYGFDTQRQPFFTMEYLQNAQPITEAAKNKPFKTKIGYILNILQALVYLHQRGILHRDLKPDNVLVVNSRVKVMDFGISLTTTGSSVAVNQAAGTVAYMAPELLEEEPVSKSADLYAVGMMAYELLTGQYPFNRDNLGRLVLEIVTKPIDMSLLQAHDDMQIALEKLLAKSRSERYHSARDVIRAFSEAIGRSIPPETEAIRESFLQAAEFVGRDQELSLILSGLEQALAGQGSAWLVGGESGIGKTRLLEEVRTHALVQGVLVLHGQGISEGGSPYQLWRSIFRALSIYVELSPEEVGILKPYVPDMSTLLGYDVPAAPDLDPQDSQERLVKTVAALVSRLSSPMLLVLEDLQWATESLVLLKQLSQVVTALPILIIGNYRNDERPELPDELPEMQFLELGRLDVAAMERLSVSMLGEVGRQAHVVELLQRESEGNVFFAVEIVRALAEEAGQLDDIGTIELPTQILTGGVQAVVERRLKRLPAEVQQWLKLIAIAGRQLDMKVVADLSQKYVVRQASDAGVRQSTGDEFLTLFSNAAVLEFQDEVWRFAHDKLREYILQQLISPDERLQLYQQVAESIERVYPDSEDYVVTLAQLWQVVGNKSKELHYAALGGKQAMEYSAYTVAVKLLSRALDLLRALPETTDNLHQQWALQVPLALSLRDTRGYTTPDFQEALDRAWELLQQLGGTAEFTLASSQIMWQKWVSHVTSGQMEQAWITAQEFNTLAQKTQNTALVIESHRQILTTAFYRGDLGISHLHLDQLLELYDFEQHSQQAIRLYGQDPAVMALSYSSLPIWLLGYPEQALSNRQKAIALAKEVDHPITTCFALLLANFPNYLKPDPMTMQADALDMLNIAQRYNSAVFVGFGKVSHGWAVSYNENREKGIEQLREGQDDLKTIGMKVLSGLFWLLLIYAYRFTLDPNEGLTILSKCIDDVEQTGERFMEAEMYRLKGGFLLEKGHVEAAETAYQKSLEIARRQSARWWELRTTTSLARLWHSQGKTNEAHAALSTIYTWFTEGFDMPDMQEARALLDELAHQI